MEAVDMHKSILYTLHRCINDVKYHLPLEKSLYMKA